MVLKRKFIYLWFDQLCTSIHRVSLLYSLLSTVADSGCDHDEEYTNIQHFYGNMYTDGTNEGVFQVRECQE